jgi:hypothetical protein
MPRCAGSHTGNWNLVLIFSLSISVHTSPVKSGSECAAESHACAPVSFHLQKCLQTISLGTRTTRQSIPRNMALTHRGAHGVIWLQRFPRFGLVLRPDTTIVGGVYCSIQILDGEPHGPISVPAGGGPPRKSNRLKQGRRSALDARNHAGGHNPTCCAMAWRRWLHADPKHKAPPTVRVQAPCKSVGGFFVVISFNLATSMISTMSLDGE